MSCACLTALQTHNFKVRSSSHKSLLSPLRPRRSSKCTLERVKGPPAGDFWRLSRPEEVFLDVIWTSDASWFENAQNLHLTIRSDNDFPRNLILNYRRKMDSFEVKLLLTARQLSEKSLAESLEKQIFHFQAYQDPQN